MMMTALASCKLERIEGSVTGGGLGRGISPFGLKDTSLQRQRGKTRNGVVIKSRLGLVRESTLVHLVIRCVTSEVQPQGLEGLQVTNTAQG